jgi:uncharacterized protein YeeX (DUF496 family)
MNFLDNLKDYGKKRLSANDVEQVVYWITRVSLAPHPV